MEGGYQVIDVRAPSEFADGHMPGALNFPLLDDAARAAVGVSYKHEGAAKARLVAMELVSAGSAAIPGGTGRAGAVATQRAGGWP